MSGPPKETAGDDFAERLSAPTPTPGGGAAAARVGLYACCLLRMVLGITLSKLKAQASAPVAVAASNPAEAALSSLSSLEAADERAARLSDRFRELESEDMAAFQAYLEALRLPRSTPEEKARRLEARTRAAARATEAPLETIRAARDALALSAEVLDLSRTTPLRAESDLAAAVELSLAAYRVAELNVRVNLRELSPAVRDATRARWLALASELEAQGSRLRSEILAKLEG
ncbi:MAG: cyclodeaminase/cyclohydrolase family protein [Planctomycetes bacterium]|nr:cyclodeaminase/cyclohydrolase family protein [Planctomycetota bacterium]